MRIFDAHMHLGESLSSGRVVDENTHLSLIRRHGIAGGLVIPFPIVADHQATHDRIAEFCGKNPGFIGGICINPLALGPEETVEEMERCARDLGFQAVKLHPASHATSPLSKWADLLFETAARLGLAFMVHTGWGGTFTLPALLIPRAQQYPDMPIILAHAGYSANAGSEAIVAAQQCSNIYLETSWCWAGDIRNMVQQVGADRVMMGTDLPENVPAVLAIYESLDVTAAEREACLWTTAARLFGLSGRE